MSGPNVDPRKEKLLSLKRREDMKHALNDELKAQYSARVPSKTIENEVQNFIKTAGLTEKNLQRLERRLDKFASRDDDACSQVSAMTGISAYTARTSMTGISAYSARTGNSAISGYSALGAKPESKQDRAPAELPRAPRAYGGSDRPATGQAVGGFGIVGKQLASIDETKEPERSKEEPVNPPPTLEENAESGPLFEWAHLDKYAAMLHERDAMSKKEQNGRMQKELRKDLDQQVADARIRKEKERESDRKYYMNQVSEIDGWKEKENQRILEVKQRYEKEKQDRDAQLEHSNNLRQNEAESRMAEDRALLEKIAEEMDMERKLFENKKKHTRDGMKKTWNETLQEQDAKKQLRQQAQSEEEKELKDYIRFLEEQEKKKKELSKERLNAHQEFISNLKSPCVEDEKERGIQAGQRAAREQVEADMRAKDLEQSKRDKIMSMRLETQEYLFEQMHEKESIRQKAADEKMKQAKILAADTEDYFSSEKAKENARKAKLFDHRREIETQMAENKKPFPGLAIAKRSQVESSEAVMSLGEMKLNKRLVTDVRSALSAR